LACIVLIGQSFSVVCAGQPQLPDDFRVSEYFGFFGSGGIDWQALNDPNNNPILVACLKGVADESLKPPGILDVQKRLEMLERGNLIKKADGRYTLAFPAVVDDKRDQLQKYAEQAALQLVPFGEKMIAQIRAQLAGRDEMIYHVLWSVVMDSGPAWDAARAEMKKKIGAGDTSTENTAWLLYPSHPFRVGTNGYNTSNGHLAITWSRNTPRPDVIGGIMSQHVSQLAQAIEQNAAITSAQAKDALGKYGLIDEAGKVRLYAIKADSQAAQSYAELGTQFGRQMMTYLDASKVAEMLGMLPGAAFVIAYHEICWQLLQDLVENKALEVPLIVAKGGTDTSETHQLVSLAIIRSVSSPLPDTEMSKEEAQAIEEFRAVKVRILAGDRYKDTSTPLHAVLTQLSALGQGQTRDYFTGLDILRAPLPPATPEEGSLWPVFAGQQELADTFILAYSKGQWIWIGNMGANYDWRSARSTFEKWAREKIQQSVPADGSGNPPAKEAQAPGQSTGNRVLSLDGQGDCMRVADSQSLQSFTEAITIEVWLKASSFYAEDGKINSVIRKNIVSGAENFLLRFRNMDGSPRAQMGLGEIGTLGAPSEFAANKWYHVAGTYDGRTITVLVNGLAVASQNASGRLRIDQSDLYVGKGDPTFSSGEYFHGELDEIRIWNVARSREQIQAAMNTPLTGKEEGLVAYWNFDDGTAKDLSGHGNDGILTADARIVEAPRPVKEQSSENGKAEINQEPPDISAYFEKTKNEILQGRKFSNQSTPVNALLTLISAYHHQDRNTLEQVFPIVRQKQFEQLASPETRSQMLAVASESVARRVEIENEPPRESDLCAVYSSQSPDKPTDQVWSFAYVRGAWRFAGSTSATDNWRTQAKQAEALTRGILLSGAEKAKALTTNTLQQKADKIEGKWNAILPEFDQTYMMRFWRKPDGTLAGAATRNSPDDRPFDGVTFENGKLRFEEKVNQGVFEGTMKEDGSTIEGKWQTPRMLTSCVLERVGDVEIEEKGQSDSGIVQSSEKQIQRLNNLVAWWKLDEADGNDVADSSGNRHGGRLVGNPQWRPGGKIGGALAFDGAGDSVQIGDEPAFDLAGPITVSAWIKVNSFDKRWQAIVTKGDSAWRLQRTAEENTLAFHCTGITSISGQWSQGIEGKKDINDGQWHHVVGVYDGSTVSLYIDGALDNSSKASGAILMNDSAVMIGGNSEQTGRDWNGLIDEVCIIGGAIDANAVHALYTGTNPIMVARTATLQLRGPNKLVAWWKFENDANDSAGANHGTVHGNPAYVDGKVGRAISFDGDDYVDCGKPDSLSFKAGDWTISAWIKTTQSGTEPANRGTVFANGGDEAGGIRYALAVNEEYLGTLVVTTDNDTYKVQAFGKTAVNNGNWHHVVGMRNADQLRVYVDGALDADASLPAGYDLSGVSQHNAYIGAITDHRDNSLFKYFVGLIDEVCIFGGAIDANGVRSLYAGEDPVKVAQKAIVARAEPQPQPRLVTGAVARGGIEGDWQLVSSQAIVEIRRKPDGTLTATIVAQSPDVAAPTIPLDKVTFENGKLRFEMMSNQGVFEGTMKEDGLTIEGQFQQEGQQTRAVVLRRIEAAPSEAAPASPEQLQVQTSGTSRIATALILVLVLAGVVAAVVFFLVRSSIRR